MPVIQSLTRGDSVAFSGLREERRCASPSGEVCQRFAAPRPLYADQEEFT
jgi:hypothetical protein